MKFLRSVSVAGQCPESIIQEKQTVLTRLLLSSTESGGKGKTADDPHSTLGLEAWGGENRPGYPPQYSTRAFPAHWTLNHCRP